MLSAEEEGVGSGQGRKVLSAELRKRVGSGQWAVGRGEKEVLSAEC